MPDPQPRRLDPAGDVVDLTQQLCDIPSVSGGERAIADAVEAALRPCAHLEVSRHDDAVVARTALGRAERVVLAGHLDTVPVAANLPVRRDGDVLHGRGTVDMKGGVAVALALAATVPDPVRDVTYVFYDHEEVEASLNGLGRLARTVPQLLEADFAVLLEPTGAAVEGGCNGTMRIEVRVPGVAAHSARAWMGRNAIHDAAPVLQRLAAFGAEDVEVDGLVYREGLNAVAIRGGIAGNVIPDECVVTVNYRFAPSRSVADAEALLRQVFDGHEVRVTDASAGARPGLRHPAAAAFVEMTGGAARPKYGWTDVARFSELGVPAVNYGPGDPLLAHRDDEWVDGAEVRRCAERLRAWLTQR